MSFVFACWVGPNDLPEGFLNEFNNALQSGLNSIDELIQIKNSKLSKEEIKIYLTKNIHYIFDDGKKDAMKLFLKLSEHYELLPVNS
jgi:predicted solute-binding protein